MCEFLCNLMETLTFHLHHLQVGKIQIYTPKYIGYTDSYYPSCTFWIILFAYLYTAATYRSFGSCVIPSYLLYNHESGWLHVARYQTSYVYKRDYHRP